MKVIYEWTYQDVQYRVIYDKACLNETMKYRVQYKARTNWVSYSDWKGLQVLAQHLERFREKTK